MTKTAELKERLMKDQTYIRLNEHEKEWAVQLLLQELQTQRESDLREVGNCLPKKKDILGQDSFYSAQSCAGFNLAVEEMEKALSALTPLGME